MIYHFNRPEWLAELPKPDLSTANVKVAIYGTEKTGEVTAHVLEQKGITFIAVDSDERKFGKNLRGVPVISSQELAERNLDAIVLIASSSFRAIIQTLLDLGFNKRQIYPCSHVVEGVDLTGSKLPISEGALIEALDKYNWGAFHVFCKSNYLLVNTLLIVPTSKCTLRCKECIAYVPYWLSRCNYDKFQTINLVKKLIDLGYEINNVCIAGGEPLLHPELPSIVSIVCDFERVGTVTIITNGTLSVKPELLSVLVKNRKKILVRVSNYGTVSRKAEEIIQLLLENGIQIAELIAEKWFKTHAIRDLKLSDNKLAAGYLGCPCTRNAGVIYSVGNRYYPCGFCYAFDNLGHELQESEFIHIDDPNFAAKLEKLFKRDVFFETCRFCQKAFNENRISVPVAEQLPQ
jgi:organic radical activating enzyme